MSDGRSRVWLSLALLLGGLVATVFVVRSAISSEETLAQQDFEFECSEVQSQILARLQSYGTVLLSGAAFLDHAEHINREEWFHFVALQAIDRRFPGVQGLGFAQLIPRQDLAEHIRKIRAEGFPAYHIRPEGDREVYSSIIFLEPFVERNLRAFGYDMFSEAVRREAMARARDQNVPALSGKVVLVQETREKIQAGTLMYVPVYRRGLPLGSVAERRAAVLGWVYSPYRMDDLLHGIMAGRDLADSRNLRLKIYDGPSTASEALLHDSWLKGKLFPPDNSGRRATRAIDMAGRTWTLSFSKLGEDAPMHFSSGVWFALIGGTSTSLFLAGLLFALLNTKFLSRRLADRLTAELRESEEKFRAIADYTVDLELWLNHAGRAIWVNPSVEPITGYSPAEVLAMPDFFLSLIANATESKDALAALRRSFLAGEVDRDRHFHCVKKTGQSYWLSFSWQPIFDQRGNSLGVRVSGRDVSELKRVHVDLQRANLVVEQSPVSVIITDVAGDIEYVNEAFTRISGYSKAEAQGRNPRFLQSGLTKPATYALMWQALKSGHNWRGEFCNRKKNSEFFWETVAFSPLRDSEGKITHYVSVKQDVTEYKKLEEALQESNERLYLAAQAGRVGIWDYRVTDGHLTWDDQMLRLYGITRKEFNSNYEVWRTGLHPDDLQRGDQEIQLAVRGEKDFDTEFRVVWRDGSVHHIRAIAQLRRDEFGRPVRLIGTNWDITKEKTSEAQLLESKTLLQLMFQASPLGFLVVDNRTDTILHFNQRFCEIWGIEHLAERMRRGELKNNDIIPDCLPALIDVPAFAASCAPLQDENNRIVLEDEITFTGQRTIRRYTTQIRDGADGYHGRFYIFEDVSAEKKLAIEIAAMLEKEREISQMKTRFISVASHEFRTPLAAAQVAVDILAHHLDQLAPLKRRELFGRINMSLRRLAEMLSEVLLLSRMDAGHVQAPSAPVDLRVMLPELIEEIRMGDQGAHRFEFHADPVLAQFLSDQNQLHHIISNLLSNAVRYSPAGTVVITRITVQDAGVRITVEDQGMGVPQEDRVRIFEPFERGSNVGNIKGTGLGLNIVKRMTTLLGGTIALEVPASGGSRFVLMLPYQAIPPV